MRKNKLFKVFGFIFGILAGCGISYLIYKTLQDDTLSDCDYFCDKPQNSDSESLKEKFKRSYTVLKSDVKENADYFADKVKDTKENFKKKLDTFKENNPEDFEELN